MRVVDEEAIARHAAVRFRSEYHYALFEYWRSAKLLRYLERAGFTNLGQVPVSYKHLRAHETKAIGVCRLLL